MDILYVKKPGPRQARALSQGHRAIRRALFRTHLPVADHSVSREAWLEVGRMESGRGHSDPVFLYKEESGGTINKIVRPGEVHALGQKGKVDVEFEVIIEDAGRCSS